MLILDNEGNITLTRGDNATLTLTVKNGSEDYDYSGDDVSETSFGRKRFAENLLNNHTAGITTGSLIAKQKAVEELCSKPEILMDYQATLQYAFDKMFTTAPKVLVRIDSSFDNEYITPDVSRIVHDIVGNNSFSVTNFSELDKLVIDVTLGQINAAYRNEVKDALDEEYATYDDIVISVTVVGN